MAFVVKLKMLKTRNSDNEIIILLVRIPTLSTTIIFSVSKDY